MKACNKLILKVFDGDSQTLPQSSQNSKFAMSLQYLKKEVRDEVDYLNAEKHQSFLQVDFNTLGIKFSYKVILSLLLGMINHSQSTPNSTFVNLYNISKLRMEFIYLHADKHQNFYKLDYRF